jgi:hypothetical protein
VESIGCFDEKSWLIGEDVSKRKLGGEACLQRCKNETKPPSFLLETSSPINHDFSSKHPIDSTIFACFTSMLVTFGILLSKIIPSEHTGLEGLKA